MRNIAASLCVLILVSASPAQSEERNTAAAHFLFDAVPIPLPEFTNRVEPNVRGSLGEWIEAVCIAPRSRAYRVTIQFENGLFESYSLDGKDLGHPIETSVIPIRNVSGEMSDLITANDGVRPVAFFHARGEDLVLVTATRITDVVEKTAPVDIVIYRVHADAIIDGTVIYFAPSTSWQTSENYLSASAGLEAAFGVTLPAPASCE